MKKITVKRAVIAVILTAVCMAAAAIPNAAALTLPTEVDPAAAVLSNKTAAYLQGGALYVKCGECVELTLVASGVDQFAVSENGAVAFTRNDALYVITDLEAGYYTLAATSVNKVELRDGAIYYLQSGRWSAL